jgi:hypothetical protein
VEVLPLSGVSGAGVPEVLAALVGALAQRRQIGHGERAEVDAPAHIS